MKKDKVLFGDEHCCNSFNLRSPLRNVSSRIKLLILLLKVGFPYILWSGPTNSLHISSPYDIVNNVIHNGNHGAGSKPGKLYHKPTTTQEETINLIQELYELMEDMGYLKSGLISYPLQKENSINRTLTVELGLYDHVVDFMEHLPYINSTSDSQSQRTNWNEPGYQNMFLLSASFADLRDDDTLRRSRDIWCSDQDIDTKLYPSEQQRPDCRSGGETKRKVLPRDLLSLTVAEHIYHHWYPDQRFRNIELPRAGSLLLDLKRNLIYAVGWGIIPSSTTYWWIKRYASNSRSSFDVAANSEYLADVDSIRSYPSRSATEALREWIENIKSLKWIPGFHHHSNEKSRTMGIYRELYKTHGWPTNFNKMSFEIACQEWIEHEHKRFTVDMLVSSLHATERRLENGLKFLEHSWKQYEQSTGFDENKQTEMDLNNAQSSVAKTRDLIDKWKEKLTNEAPALVEESKKLVDAGSDLKFALDSNWYLEYKLQGGCECWVERLRIESVESKHKHSLCMKCL